MKKVQTDEAVMEQIKEILFKYGISEWKQG